MTIISANTGRLTPEQVELMSFQQPPDGQRGLDGEQVRAFCVQVHQELVQLAREKNELEGEVQRLRRQVRELGGDDAARHGPENVHVLAVRILSKAQQTADRYVADAQSYSRQLAEDARLHRDEILTEARSQAAVLLDKAHTNASRAAVNAAARSPAAEERHDLEAELAHLRTFSEVYRTHLRAYLEALLRSVDEWSHEDKASLANLRAELSGS